MICKDAQNFKVPFQSISRSHCKLLDKQTRLEIDHHRWIHDWGCRVDAECCCSISILPLHQCRCTDWSGSGHHLSAETGLHHSVFHQEEAVCYWSGHLRIWYWYILICSSDRLVKDRLEFLILNFILQVIGQHRLASGIAYPWWHLSI